MTDETDRLARLEERLGLVTQLVEQFGPIAGQVLRAELGAQENARELERLESAIDAVRLDLGTALTRAEDELHGSLRRAEDRLEKNVDRVEAACASLGEELRKFAREAVTARDTAVAARGASRATIIVGALGAAATVTAVVLGDLL